MIYYSRVGNVKPHGTKTLANEIRRIRIRRGRRPGYQWERETEPSEWLAYLGPQHGFTGQVTSNARIENAPLSIEEEQRRTAVIRITSVHAGIGLIYMDEYENPLGYYLHTTVEEAMFQAQFEYGIAPEDWEPVLERLPWKHRHRPKSRR